jgi:hypothetical protein
MKLEDYDYDACCYIPKKRRVCLQAAIQYHGYRIVLKELLKMLNSQQCNVLEQFAVKLDIQAIFFPYDTMITSSGNFYSDELEMYV